MPEKSIYAQQNLVPNPSFENYTGCPTNEDQLYLAVPWNRPTTGSSDYFNSCNSSGLVGYPNNYFGNQVARTGLAYAGFHPHAFEYREYVQAPLIQSLIAGKKYCVQFFLALSDSSEYAIDEIGAYFSTDAISSSNSYPLPVTPQITSAPNFFIINKNDWTLVEGEFTAVGGEKYITIGNFKDDANTDSLYLGGNHPVPYYYIDDVSVYLCDSIDTIPIIPTVFTPNGDGINDYLSISLINKKNILFEIFNRWGQKIYSTKDEIIKWDGQLKGAPLTDGTYYYLLRYDQNDKTINTSGFFQLIK